MYLVVLEPLYAVAQPPCTVKPTWIRPILQTRQLRMDEAGSLTHGHRATSKGQHHFPSSPMDVTNPTLTSEDPAP